DEFPARRLRFVRGLRWQTLQSRDAGGEVQRLLDRRSAGVTGGGCAADSGELSPDQAEATNPGGRRTRVHSSGAVGGNAVGWGSAAHQAGARVEQATDG